MKARATLRTVISNGTVPIIACVVTVVCTLAVLQYRWNRDASDAAGMRLADSLQLSMINWHLDLFRNLSELALTMRAPQARETSVEEYAGRLAEWRTLARYPDLVAGVYIARRDAAGALALARFSGDTLRPEPVVDARQSAFRAELWQAAGRLARSRPPAATPTNEPGPLAESYYNIGAALRDWHFDPEAITLGRALAPTGPWLILDLDMSVIRHRILPELAARYFQGTNGLDYDVAVVAGRSRPLAVYTSQPGFGADGVPDADGRMDIFGRNTSGRAIEIFHRPSFEQGPTAAVGVSWFPLVGSAPNDADWHLVVRHRRGGSLAAFVSQTRQRGMLISGVALSVLVLSLWMLLVATTRAQRLARLQMDFVTTVSHELRTPLAIIGSAAENIAAGVVESPHRLREYGEVIGHEVGQLSALVERILRFAATRDGRQTYAIERTRPGDIIAMALENVGGLVRAADFAVEQAVPADLPDVLVDCVAASQCLENLITNALKYGHQGAWMRIAAEACAGPGDHHPQVRITVADRGPGIPPDERERIFEPFYRTPDAKAAQTHGTGLGLALARQIATDMGGQLTVESPANGGSIFCLALPAPSNAPNTRVADVSAERMAAGRTA